MATRACASGLAKSPQASEEFQFEPDRIEHRIGRRQQLQGPVTQRGATDVKRRFEILSSYRRGGRLEPERLVDRGDEVLFLGRLCVRSVRGGPEIGQSVNVLHTLLDGKIFLREAATSRA